MKCTWLKHYFRTYTKRKRFNVEHESYKFEQLHFVASVPLIPDPLLSPGFSIKCTLFARENVTFWSGFGAYLPPHPCSLPPSDAARSSIEVRHWLVIFHCTSVTVMGNATQKEKPGAESDSESESISKAKGIHVQSNISRHHLSDSLDKSGRWVSSKWHLWAL